MTVAVPLDVEAVIAQSDDARSTKARRRSRCALGVPITVTLMWIIWVSSAGHWSRVSDHWASAVTMIFGSFVAGSTPQGGGAVAFPVFTKILEIPSEVARTFSLTIQSVGMAAASLGILINRRAVERRVLMLAVPASIVGFLCGVVLMTDRSKPFAPSTLPGPYVKVTFTVIVTAMAFITWLGYRNQLIERRDALPRGNWRIAALVVGCSILGGLTSSLVGSGSDVFVYLAVVSLVGLSPRVGVATSVLVMTTVSLVGLLVLSIGEGHLDVALADAATVGRVDGRSVSIAGDVLDFGETGTAAAAKRFDLFGLWLAAVPVVAWGAPLGAAVSARATDRQVVRFVVALALVEFVSTVVFLDDLRTDRDLAVFAVCLFVLGLGALGLANRHRHAILGLPRADVKGALTRGAIDVGPRLDEQLTGRSE